MKTTGKRFGTSAPLRFYVALLTGLATGLMLTVYANERLANIANQIAKIQVTEQYFPDATGFLGPNKDVNLEIIAYNKQGQVLPLTEEDANTLFRWEVQNNVNLQVAMKKEGLDRILTFASDPHRHYVQIVTGNDSGAAQVVVRLADQFQTVIPTIGRKLISTGGTQIKDPFTQRITALTPALAKTGTTTPFPQTPSASPPAASSPQLQKGPALRQLEQIAGRNIESVQVPQVQGQALGAGQQHFAGRAPTPSGIQAPSPSTGVTAQPSTMEPAPQITEPAPPTSPASPHQLGPNTYTAEPAPVGETGTGAPNVIDGSQGQVLSGQGAAVGAPDRPDALDTDGDGYLDYAEKWAGTDPKQAADHPTDLSPEQANNDPGALEWYKAGWGRANRVPIQAPPSRQRGFSAQRTPSPSLAQTMAAVRPPPPPSATVASPPGMSGGDAALVGVGVAGAVVAAVAVAGAAGNLANNYKCREGYSLCTDGACCPTHYIHGAWGAYHGSNGACYPSAESAARAAMHGVRIAACADERRYGREYDPKTRLQQTMQATMTRK
jgi:hypothetical protein